LVARAKTKPGGLSYASQGIGSSGHLLGEMFARDAGVAMVHVPYRGVVPSITDLIAGRVDFLFSSPISAFAYVQDGRVHSASRVKRARRSSRILPPWRNSDFPTSSCRRGSALWDRLEYRRQSSKSSMRNSSAPRTLQR
jgi:tripartite-type tricarboxylate transporter receptor subunit TctC